MSVVVVDLRGAVMEGGGGCAFGIPQGELHCGKLSPLNGWRSFSGWRMHA